jgi:hypothetical protein
LRCGAANISDPSAPTSAVAPCSARIERRRSDGRAGSTPSSGGVGDDEVFECDRFNADADADSEADEDGDAEGSDEATRATEGKSGACSGGLEKRPDKRPDSGGGASTGLSGNSASAVAAPEPNWPAVDADDADASAEVAIGNSDPPALSLRLPLPPMAPKLNEPVSVAPAFLDTRRTSGVGLDGNESAAVAAASAAGVGSDHTRPVEGGDGDGDGDAEVDDEMGGVDGCDESVADTRRASDGVCASTGAGMETTRRRAAVAAAGVSEPRRDEAPLAKPPPMGVSATLRSPLA